MIIGLDTDWAAYVGGRMYTLWGEEWSKKFDMSRISGNVGPNASESDENFWRWGKERGADYRSYVGVSLLEDDNSKVVKPQDQLIWWEDPGIGLVWIRDGLVHQPGFVSVPPWESILLLTNVGDTDKEEKLKWLYNHMKKFWRETHDSWSSKGGPKEAPLCVLPGDLREDLVNDMKDFFLGRDLYDELDLPYRRAILLYGDPGNGKTTTASYLAFQHEGVYKMVESIGKEWNDGALRRVFKEAAENAPTVLILEDIDGLNEAAVGRSFFLNLLDGILTSYNSGVYVIGTTNYPDEVDPALFSRPGRFDRVIEIKNPVPKQISTYVQKRFGKHLSEEEQSKLSKASEGLSLSAVNELGIEWCWAKLRGTDYDVVKSASKILSTKIRHDKGQVSRGDVRAIGFQHSSVEYYDEDDD